MPLNNNLKKILIIGSGPIVIGQAAEFDYSGTQACKAIKEEGIETVLVNSNPATIMTDNNIADKVYIEPINIESLSSIIKKEKPDGLLAGFGGQTALNISMELEQKGILDKYNVKLLGIEKDTIIKSEDRDEFKKLMESINEPICKSIIATDLKECENFANKFGYPVIIRPAYTLGGTGGGIAKNYNELIKIASRGIKNSPIGQIILEQSVAGWKELEYEVMRDEKGNVIIVCNMENFDPVGVHTGDSIVVAPSQTLTDKEYQMLRRASIKIIKSLDIKGGCNIQFALDPNSNNYVVIEVNPRVSRSSALASKAVGYPIAKLAAKIAIGFSLDELKNYVTKNSSACFEPTLDYVVVKFPKWPFDKFDKADKKLGTQMKATGEVMAISRTFESALLKAVTCLEGDVKGLSLKYITSLDNNVLLKKINECSDERLFLVAEALRRDMDINYIHELTWIDLWFLNAIKNIINVEEELKNKLDKEVLYKAESYGFTDDEIVKLSGYNHGEIDNLRKENNIYPVFKMVDTCSGEFIAKTPYFYSCYEDEDESIITDSKKVIVIGSGPIRIGQGIEFDYSCVHGIWALKDLGYESIIINNNPETVSTDFDIADKLYFESLYIDDVLNIINKEKPEGVVLQLGGQTSINLASKLYEKGVNILGTSYNSIDLSEDRYKFSNFLEKINVNTPKGYTAIGLEDALKIVKEIGFPIVVRPSYVIGGKKMKVIRNKKSLIEYIKDSVKISKECPVFIDEYIEGIEIEVDAVSDGKDILIPGIMEHIEKTGVHSGDSITVYPYLSLDDNTIKKIVDFTKKIANNLDIKGLLNIQYVFDGKDVYVIEVNPRASRTVPILSKVTNIPMVKLAMEVMLGNNLKNNPYGLGLIDKKNFYAVKVPVFSNEKLTDVDVSLGPEMKSTGEVLGIDKDLDIALYKGFKAAGYNIAKKGNMFISLNEEDKLKSLDLLNEYSNLGFNLFASKRTSEFLKNNNINCKTSSLDEMIKDIDKINIIINTPTEGNKKRKKGFKLRRKATERNISVFTSLDTLKAFLKAIKIEKNNDFVDYNSMNYYID
ncbi:MAG: carbamoyl-phosphate synthase (glutamine-hydrolyzing) large subunit [Firmicutes bacterium]|nr:carbamoyl-phosphate synthase (glutamine-hydrolyzing) large subunit [Bacillota bacterium]